MAKEGKPAGPAAKTSPSSLVVAKQREQLRVHDSIPTLADWQAAITVAGFNLILDPSFNPAKHSGAMEFANYSRVRITTDKYGDQGVHVGNLGYIIEVYQHALEMEFSREDGTTIAALRLAYDEVEPAPETGAE